MLVHNPTLPSIIEAAAHVIYKFHFLKVLDNVSVFAINY